MVNRGVENRILVGLATRPKIVEPCGCVGSVPSVVCLALDLALALFRHQLRDGKAVCLAQLREDPCPDTDND